VYYERSWNEKFKNYSELRGGGADSELVSFENCSNTQVAGPVSRWAFTLAEVLITLGIIGVVAALTLPSIITNIQNRGYVEGLKKNYSVLQQVTNKIIEEEGTADNWSWVKYNFDTDNSGAEYIVQAYKKHLQTVCSPLKPFSYDDWRNGNFACGKKRPPYKNLDGTDGKVLNYPLFVNSYTIVLTDGTLLGLNFRSNTIGIYYGLPSLVFTLDVNGLKGPNKVGRDVFFLYLSASQSKVLPFGDTVFDGKDFRNTCNKLSSGYSCAYRVITEGKMNY